MKLADILAAIEAVCLALPKGTVDQKHIETLDTVKNIVRLLTPPDKGEEKAESNDKEYR